MFAETDTIDGGFADSVFDAQAVFKALMDAMARPGVVIDIRPLAAPPAPLSATGAAVALTLCDHDTPIWLDQTLQASAAVRSYLAFHSGAPLTEGPDGAAFALAANPAELPPLGDFAQGTQEYPDRSTTLIVRVDTFTEGARLLLEGPGIETTATLAPSPLPVGFIAEWQDNRARFPRGVDLILAAPGAVACLPRTVKIMSMEG